VAAVVTPPWPLCSATARLLFLKAVCAVAEGADVPSHVVPDALSSRCPPDACAGAVLGDALRRVAVLGGREGMSRSLGSVYGGAVTRFLGGSLRGVVSRVIDTPGVKSDRNGVAVSRDGRRLLVSNAYGRRAIHEYSIEDGCELRVVGRRRHSRQLKLGRPYQVWVAADGFVFVADAQRGHVLALSPDLSFHSVIGDGQLSSCSGVCANADVVVVAEQGECRLSVFRRADGGVITRFGSGGDGDGHLRTPLGLCFMHSDRHVAVADYGSDRVSVFSIDGEFIRHVGVGVLKDPVGVACSAFDELVVSDTGYDRIAVFSDVGDVLMSFGDGDQDFRGVAVHGGAVFAQECYGERCVLWS
jgi:hypothetical protein